MLPICRTLRHSLPHTSTQHKAADIIEQLVEAVEKARDKFREYAELHTRKLTDTSAPDFIAIGMKIRRNEEMADMLDTALETARKPANGVG